MARTQQSFRRKSHGVSERWRELRACPNLTVFRLLEAHLRGRFKKRRRRPEVPLPVECQAFGVHCSRNEHRAETAKRELKLVYVL